MAGEGIQEETIREQVERIRASGTFHNKEALRRLLAYLADRSADGTADGLKEYSVGVAVFGKPESYDPQIDSSVRVQVGRLRQKLEEYYTTEGRNDPVVIDLPLRQFTLRFLPRASDTPPDEPGRLWKDWRLWAGGALVLVAGMLLGALMRPAARRSEAPKMTPALQAFWAPVTGSSRSSLICVGTPLFVGIRGKRYRDPRVDDFEEAQKSPIARRLQEMLGAPKMAAAYNFTGVGEASAAFLLARMFGSWNTNVDIRRTTSLTWDEMSAHNLVFLGPVRFTPQLRKMPVEPTFVVEQTGIRDLHAKPGERAMYQKVYEGDADDQELAEDYAVVARLPGIHGNHLYLLTASSSAGSWAAAKFVTQPNELQQLIRHAAGNSGELPPYFEAVIRAKVRDLVPVELSYVTHRSLQPQRR